MPFWLYRRFLGPNVVIDFAALLYNLTINFIDDIVDVFEVVGIRNDFVTGQIIL